MVYKLLGQKHNMFLNFKSYKYGNGVGRNRWKNVLKMIKFWKVVERSIWFMAIDIKKLKLAFLASDDIEIVDIIKNEHNPSIKGWDFIK